MTMTGECAFLWLLLTYSFSDNTFAEGNLKLMYIFEICYLDECKMEDKEIREGEDTAVPPTPSAAISKRFVSR